MTTREPVITEITAGSGFYAPTLFDRYAYSSTPAAMFAMPDRAEAERLGRDPPSAAATPLRRGERRSAPHTAPPARASC